MSEQNENRERISRLFSDIQKKGISGVIKDNFRPVKVQSIITYCKDCNIQGINLPGNKQCGNCGSWNTTNNAPKPRIPIDWDTEDTAIWEM